MKDQGIPLGNFHFCFRYKPFSQELKARMAAPNAAIGEQIHTVDHNPRSKPRQILTEKRNHPACRRAAVDRFTANLACLPSGTIPFVAPGSLHVRRFDDLVI